MDEPHSWEDQLEIDHSSIRPLYVQVKEELEQWIVSSLHDGTLSPGDRLPSENELSERLDVSVITIKRSLDELRRQGLIQRIQGRGSFVAGKEKIVLSLRRLFSLTEFTKEQGMHPARVTIEISETRASWAVARHLQLAPGERVAKLTRIRLMDKLPVAVETSYLTIALLPGFLNRYTDQIALYELLENEFGQEIVQAEDILEAVLINPFESQVLEVPVGSMGIILERTGYTQEGMPLEYTKTVFRGDLCSFSIEYQKGSPPL
jgi:GntR family transcriptional regulator